MLQEAQTPCDERQVSELKDRRIWVSVKSDNVARALHSGYMLNGAADNSNGSDRNYRFD
jgi:hypothetical protein